MESINQLYSINLEEFNKKASPSLVGDAEMTRKVMRYSYTFGITINYPRDNSYKFLQRTVEEQKKLLIRFYQDFLKVHLLTFSHAISHRCFEYCKDGVVHLHTIYSIRNTEQCYRLGLLSDIVKILLRSFKLRCKFDTKYMYYDWEKYRSPAICVKLYDNDKDIESWVDYINKDQCKLNMCPKELFLLEDYNIESDASEEDVQEESSQEDMEGDELQE